MLQANALAKVVPGASEQPLRGLQTQMVWEEMAPNQRRVKIMRASKTEDDGVLIIDDTGFAKQGQHSVGIAGNIRAPWARWRNWQVTVNCHYAKRTLT